jgi:hypothetical protein
VIVDIERERFAVPTGGITTGDPGGRRYEPIGGDRADRSSWSTA